MPNMNDAPREVAGAALNHAATGQAGTAPRKLHPMLIVAAVAVTLFSAVGIGVMTGVIPNAHSGNATKPDVVIASTPPSAAAGGAALAGAGTVSDAALPEAPLPPPTTLKPIENKTIGQPGEKGRAPQEKFPAPRTSVATNSQPRQTPTPTYAREIAPTYNANTSPVITPDAAPRAPEVIARAAPSICRNCGTVDSVIPIARAGEGSGAGAVLGGLLGGVLGHQAGQGRGKDVATVAGAVGGAVIGNQIEKSNGVSTSYEVRVRLEDGTFQTVRYDRAPDLRSGDRVRVENGRLIRG